jgi:hypothetical protein
LMFLLTGKLPSLNAHVRPRPSDLRGLDLDSRPTWVNYTASFEYSTSISHDEAVRRIRKAIKNTKLKKASRGPGDSRYRLFISDKTMDDLRRIA